MSIARSILALIFFLTILPSRRGWRIEDAAKCFYLVPLASIVRSLIVIAPSLLIDRYVGSMIASIMLLVLYVVVTRGLHIDGLADYLDAVGSLKKGEEALRVMKDPRKGSFAILAVSMYVGIFLTCTNIIMSSIHSVLKLLGVLSSIFVWSDEAMFILAATSRPSPYVGLGRLFVENSKNVGKRIANGAIVCVLTVLLYRLVGPEVLAPSICSIVNAILIRADALRRLGFVNGDVLGASNELSKIASIVVIASLVGAPK